MLQKDLAFGSRWTSFWRFVCLKI